GSRVSTWLLDIARSKSLAASRHETTAEWGANARGTSDSDNLSIALQPKQYGSILADSLANLCLQHREVIDLVYYHRRSIEEIAEIVHVAPNVVRLRMSQARQELTELFGGQALGMFGATNLFKSGAAT